MNFIAIDTETTPLPPEGKVRSDFHVPDMVCYTWAETPGPQYGACRTGLCMWDGGDSHIGRLIYRENCTFVFHNAKFDLAVLSKWDPTVVPRLKQLVADGRVLDTMVMYALRYPLTDRRRSLDQIYRHLFREKLEKGPVRTGFRRGRPLTQAERDYAIGDAVATLRVATRLRELSYGELAREPEEHLVAAKPLYDGPDPEVLYSQATAYLAWYLEPEGMTVNHDTVAENYVRFQDQEDALCAQLYDAGLMRAVRPAGAVNRPATYHCEDTRWTIQTRSPLVLFCRKGNQKDGYHTVECDGKWSVNERVVREAFLEVVDEHNLDAPRAADGSVSLDGEYWEENEHLLPPILKTYMELVKCRKYLSSFIAPLYHQKPERVYPHYRIPGAVTFRWACWRPNKQQEPKVLRSQTGGRMIGADFKSLECYTLAHVMSALGIKGPMLETLAQEDIHSFVSGKIGVTRQAAKIATFGLGGGMGNKRFYHYLHARGLDVTWEEACELRSKWLRFFSDVRAYLDLFRFNAYDMCPPHRSKREWLHDLGFDVDEEWPSSFDVSRKIGGKITVVLPSGRVIPQRTFSQAANAFFQGTGADVMTLAFVRMCKLDIPTCAVVHDSAYTTDLSRGPLMTLQMLYALQTVCPTVGSIAPEPEPEINDTFF